MLSWALSVEWGFSGSFFFFNDTATTEIYTLSLHDALPIWRAPPGGRDEAAPGARRAPGLRRSEEHTSELQSPKDLVCRLLLEKKKNTSRAIGNGIRRKSGGRQKRATPRRR